MIEIIHAIPPGNSLCYWFDRCGDCPVKGQEYCVIKLMDMFDKEGGMRITIKEAGKVTTCRECGLTSDKPEGDLQGDNWIIAGRYILCPKCREREWPVGDYVRTPIGGESMR